MKTPFGDMEGWKTKVTTVTGILSGLAMMGTSLSADVFNPDLFFGGLALIFFACGLTGAGHKLDKVKKAFIAYTGTNQSNKPEKPVKKDSGQVDMKLIVLVFALAVALILPGCATFDKMYPKKQASVCDQTEAAGSVICRETQKMGLQVEQMDSLLLDAVAIALIVNPEDKQTVEAFITKIEVYLTANPMMTFMNLIGFLEDEQEKSALIAAIVARRLDWLNLDELIKSYDFKLIVLHLEHQKAQLGLDVSRWPKAIPKA